MVEAGCLGTFLQGETTDGTHMFEHRSPQQAEQGHGAALSAQTPPRPCLQADVAASGPASLLIPPTLLTSHTCIFQSLKRYLNMGFSPPILMDNFKHFFQ